MRFVERVLDAGACRLNYAVGPENGPPLLMLHGVTRRWQSFLPILPALAMRWQIYALDFRGHGGSTSAAGDYRVVDYVDDAVCMLEHVVPGPAVLYGHSLGSMVAARTAAVRSDRVLAVALEDPPLHTMGERIADGILHSFFAGMQRVACQGGTLAEMTRTLAAVQLSDGSGGPVQRLDEIRDPVSLRFTASCLKQLDSAVFRPILARMWLDGFPVEDTFRNLACPALLLQADPDAGGMLMDEDAQRIAELMPECLRIPFPQLPHLLHWAEPAGVLKSLLAFLETLRD